MKLVSCVFLVGLVLSLAACGGRNGELDVYDSLDKVSEGSGQLSKQPSAPVYQQEQPDSEGCSVCCSCPTAADCECGCCTQCQLPPAGEGGDVVAGGEIGEVVYSDGEDLTEAEDGAEGEVPAGGEEGVPDNEIIFIPKLKLPVSVFNQVVPINPIDLPFVNTQPGAPNSPATPGEDETRSGTDTKRFPCLEVDDPASHWWLVYQLTGGLLSNAELENKEVVTEEVEEGIHYHITATLPGKDEVVLELDFVTGVPEEVGDAVFHDPSNYSLKYYQMPYADPVFNNVFINGEVVCKGKSYYYKSSGTWERYHICGTTGGIAKPLSYKVTGEYHGIWFGTNRVFKGDDYETDSIRFNGGNIWVDGVSYGLNQSVSEEVLECIDSTGR